MLTNTRRIFKETFQNISTEKGNFIATFVTMSVIFLMLEFFGAYFINMQKLNDFIKTNIQIKVYLKHSLSVEKMEEVKKGIYAINDVKGIKYKSKDVALQEMSQELKLQLDMSDNPLSDVIYINVDENVNLGEIKTQLQKIDGIDQVDVRSDFVEKVSRFVKGLNILTIYFAIGASIPIFILIFNFVNAGIALRRNDIEIMTLVGASRWYIKMPFILEGLLNVFLSSVVTLGLFYFIYSNISQGIAMVLPLVPVAPIKYVMTVNLSIVAAYGIIITVIASYISVRKYIKIHGD